MKSLVNESFFWGKANDDGQGLRNSIRITKLVRIVHK